MTFDFDTLISIVILLAIAATIWRGGSKNPVGTGALERQISGLQATVKSIGDRVGGLATKDELASLKREIEEIDARTASTADIQEVKGDIKALGVQLDGETRRLGERIGAVKDAADRTEQGVQRIEGYFLQRGVER